jgi:hypothetical protein
MRFIILGLLAVCFTGALKAQPGIIYGKISYISSQNVYVKFDITDKIRIGDTLYFKNEKAFVPVLVVMNQSSTSCICKPVSNIPLSVSMMVAAKISTGGEMNTPEQTQALHEETKMDSSIVSVDTGKIKTTDKQKITGNIGVSAYSNTSNINTADSYRFQYLFMLNALNIANSKISAESYISFRHEKGQWNLVQDNLFQALKIYNLSISYNNDKNTRVVLGRRINPKISSIGAIDGIQFEYKWRDFFMGAILGSRPDNTDYSFDITLPQYGAYLGHGLTNSSGEMHSSVAFIEQMNTSKTDRRFAYFQHSNSLLKNLYFFGSVEIDLYKNINENPENTFSLASSYLFLRVKPFKRLSLSASYDNRKNVIYYETYKSYINQIIDIEARQGISFQMNYSVLKNISFGFKTGYRFPNKNSKESRNLYGYISYSNIPIIGSSVTIAMNSLETSYINGKILNLNIDRNFFKGKLYTNGGYQWVKYSFYGNEITIIQHVINLSASWRFYKSFSFSVNYEKTLENSDQYNRLVFQIRKRF